MSNPQPIPIIDQLNTLDTIESSYDKRLAIDNLDQSVTYSVSVVIDKIAKNYSYVREDGYRDAYYITGDVSSSQHRVKVLLPTAMNSEVESWNEGETRILETSISDWDLAYKQFGLLGRSSIANPTNADSAPDATASLPSKTETIEKQSDARPEGSTEQNDAIATAEEQAIVTEVESINETPELVEPAEESVVPEELSGDNEQAEPVQLVDVNQAEAKVVDLEPKATQPEHPKGASPVNEEIEDFIEIMESPTPLEQLAEEHADAQPRDSGDELSIQTAIPLQGDVPILKNVPTRAGVSTETQTKRFSNHAPVRPKLMPREVKGDAAQDKSKMIIKIIVGIAVGIIVLMCLCCGLLSGTGG